MRYGALKIGQDPDLISMAKSIAREEGIPGWFSKKTSKNLFTTGIMSKVLSFSLKSMTHANIT